MTKRTSWLKGIGAVLVALTVGLAVWWFSFVDSASPSVASAQEIVANACDLDSPNFDIVGTIRQAPLYGSKLVDFKAEVSNKDYHIELRSEDEFVEFIHVDGAVLLREGVDAQWEESPLTPQHWMGRLIGTDLSKNTICIPVESTHLVGTEVVKKMSTTKYVWAYNWVKDEAIGTANPDPWTHRWEVWIDADGQLVQIRTSTKDSKAEFKTTEDWDIVTSKIINVGEENVITKPQS